jgi:hypothetical protein
MLEIMHGTDGGSILQEQRCSEQALEQRALGGLLVRVKRLWIELKRECLDLRFVKPVRPAGQALSDTKIVKIQLVQSDSGFGLAAHFNDGHVYLLRV